MRVDLKRLEELKNKVIVIDGAYHGFVGTELENDTFSVTVKGKSREDNIDLSVACQDENGNIKAGLYSKESFFTSIVSASGFYNENDVELSDDDAKEFLWEFAPKVLEDAISKAISSFVTIEEEKKSVEENLTSNTANGFGDTEIVA